MITKNQHTLRVWHGTLEAFDVFLARKERAEPEIVTLYSTPSERFHIWAFGAVAQDVCATLGLVKLKTIVLEAKGRVA